MGRRVPDGPGGLGTRLGPCQTDVAQEVIVKPGELRTGAAQGGEGGKGGAKTAEGQRVHGEPFRVWNGGGRFNSTA